MTTLILNARIVNEGSTFDGDVLIKDRVIERIDGNLQRQHAHRVIDAGGNYLLPGVIDDQVHFREPGLTQKATIHSESRAAVAGGVTSYMEMPNTVPPAFTRKRLEEKYAIASKTSLANYSFYIGASHDNLDEVLQTDPRKVCGLKIFMGSSTGNLLVDDPVILERFFSKIPFLIATHCEDELTISGNAAKFREQYGEVLPPSFHAKIRSAEACYKSSSLAVSLARKHGTRLHVLHISTARETELFDNTPAIQDKRITAEACIHHLWFSDADYERLGMLIKWNPAIKSAADRAAILHAVLDGRIDVIATDHAPHTLEEKKTTYFNSPSGGPLIQHSLVAMLEMWREKKIRIERVVEKMAHHPSILFRIDNRGFIREGYFADLVIVNPDQPWTVSKSNILAKCGWSPFEGVTFHSTVTHTFVSGHLAYENGRLDDGKMGERLLFNPV